MGLIGEGGGASGGNVASPSVPRRGPSSSGSPPLVAGFGFLVRSGPGPPLSARAGPGVWCTGTCIHRPCGHTGPVPRQEGLGGPMDLVHNRRPPPARQAQVTGRLNLKKADVRAFMFISDQDNASYCSGSPSRGSY